MWGKKDIVELLINKSGCKINDKDLIGFTALHWGIQKNK